jgi:CelD/BcsL family acetyltransferase involved in cellulose biosynthesis
VTLRIILKREIPDDPDLCRQWNAVAMQMESPQVFYTCEWALAVQKAYREQFTPLLLLGYDENNLVGIASLATRRSHNEVTFLSSTTADYCDFLSISRLSTEFLKAVLTELRNHSLTSIVLANLPADSSTTDALHLAAADCGFRVFARPAYLCAQAQLGRGEGRSTLKSTLAGKKKLRRYLREMEREGPVTFAHLQIREQIEAALPAFIAAHVARFAATGRTSSLSTPERRIFIEELTRRFDGSNVVTLSELRIQDRPVAWNFGFQFHNSWFWYQTTFDSRHEENSPGHCLLSRIVIEACDMEQMEVVDLGLGAEGYKERFGNSTRQTLHVTVTSSTARYLREVVRHGAANALKRSPKVESAVRRILGR